jgi:hypothetical protein
MPSLPPSHTALTELIAACRVGVKKYAQIAPEDFFNDRLNKIVAKEFGTRDRDCLRLIGAEGSAGLLAARNRSGASARSHFAAGERLLATAKLSARARKFAEATLFPQKAYELYTHRQFSRATKLLRQAFLRDIALEADRSFSILLMHRVQLLNNWMRVESRRGRWQQALTLGIALLEYLEAPAPRIFRALPPPFNRGWTRKLRGVPANLTAGMHDQIARETASTFRKALAARPRQVKALISHLARQASGEAQIGHWVKFQATRFNRPVDDVCFAASAALRRGGVPSAPLWLSIAEDIQTILAAGRAQD